MAFLILLCFILQTSVFRWFDFAGIVPNLLILLTASYGFMDGEKTGLLIGFFCGLLCDIFFADYIGLFALIYMYIGYLNGKFNMLFYPEDIKLPLGLVLLSDISYGVVTYVLTFLIRGKLDFAYYFGSVILPETVYTILVSCLFYPVLLWIHEKLELRERKRARRIV